MLANDVSRCGGVGNYEDGWRDGCEACARRNDIADDETVYPWLTPPPIIAFWCEFHIAPNDQGNRQTPQAAVQLDTPVGRDGCAE